MQVKDYSIKEVSSNQSKKEDSILITPNNSKREISKQITFESDNDVLKH